MRGGSPARRYCDLLRHATWVSPSVFHGNMLAGYADAVGVIATGRDRQSVIPTAVEVLVVSTCQFKCRPSSVENGSAHGFRLKGREPRRNRSSRWVLAKRVPTVGAGACSSSSGRGTVSGSVGRSEVVQRSFPSTRQGRPRTHRAAASVCVGSLANRRAPLPGQYHADEWASSAPAVVTQREIGSWLSARRKITTALWPPNPNPLDAATVMSARRATLGT